MNILSKLNDGFTIMVIGMGVVFAFLIIMVFALQFMSKIVEILNKYFPEAIPETIQTKSKRAGKDDEIIAVAIAAALKKM